jgi:hypothetical protein
MQISMAGSEYVNRNKLRARYLKYRYYYVNLDLSGFGEYSKAVYEPLLPKFDQWFERKSIDDIPLITSLLGDNTPLHGYPAFRPETGEVIDFHIKVLALSLDGVILYENRSKISGQFLQEVICNVSKHTQLYDFSDRLCFFITIRLFIEMLKVRFAHFGDIVTALSLRDFANEDTLNPKPREEVRIPW